MRRVIALRRYPQFRLEGLRSPASTRPRPCGLKWSVLSPPSLPPPPSLPSMTHPRMSRLTSRKNPPAANEGSFLKKRPRRHPDQLRLPFRPPSRCIRG